MYSFDLYGWLSDSDIPGRQTEVVPPSKPWPDGKQPNFTGYVWQLMDYVAPSAPTAAPPVSEARRITVLAFLSRFTTPERIKIRTEAKTNVVVEDFLAMVNAATFIDLSRQDTVNGVGYLVQQGWLGAARADSILNGEIADIERPETARQ